MHLGEPCDQCPSHADASAQWHPDMPILPGMLQAASAHMPSSSPCSNRSGDVCYVAGNGQDKLLEDTEGKIFSFSPVLFFHYVCFSFCPVFAISQLSKFTGALPQGEMKASGCIWWCRQEEG